MTKPIFWGQPTQTNILRPGEWIVPQKPSGPRPPPQPDNPWDDIHSGYNWTFLYHTKATNTVRNAADEPCNDGERVASVLDLSVTKNRVTEDVDAERYVYDKNQGVCLEGTDIRLMYPGTIKVSQGVFFYLGKYITASDTSLARWYMNRGALNHSTLRTVSATRYQTWLDVEAGEFIDVSAQPTSGETSAFAIAINNVPNAVVDLHINGINKWPKAFGAPDSIQWGGIGYFGTSSTVSSGEWQLCGLIEGLMTDTEINTLLIRLLQTVDDPPQEIGGVLASEQDWIRQRGVLASEQDRIRQKRVVKKKAKKRAKPAKKRTKRSKK